MEAPSVVGTGDEIRSLITLVDSGELPEISYLSALSFENENYDIVGIYWGEEEMPAAYDGRFIDASMMGRPKSSPRAIFLRTKTRRWAITLRILGRRLRLWV